MWATRSAFVLALVAASTNALPTNVTRQNGTAMVYDFANITASSELSWQPCFDRFLCTYLTVPLDYDDKEGNTTNVAFIKYQSKNGTGQDILYNPGGPGGSGVSTLIGQVDEYIGIFGTEYNFVAFDPRGVNNTGPFLACNTDQSASHKTDPIAQQWTQAKANGEYCTLTNEGSESKYVGTSAVVQDMMYFTELQAKANGQDPKEAKIWYYGVSYGTIIGQTLAAMYPERLGRIIVDGNVNGIEYYNGYVPSAIEDADKSFGFFFEYCYEAGPDLCPLTDNCSSPAEVESRYKAVLQQLDAEPVIVANSSVVIARSDLESLAYRTMYFPNYRYYAFAKYIAGLEQGDASAYSTVQLVSSGLLADATPANANYTTAASQDALTLITCVDSAGQYPLTSIQKYKDAVDAMYAESTYGAMGYAYSNPLTCNGMDIVPPQSQHFSGFDPNESINTSVPLLFVSSTGDPITPLSSAQKMSKIFSGSIVLAQKAPGHSSNGVKSDCTHKYMRDYMKNASLPSVDTVCEVSVTPKEVMEASKKYYEKVEAVSAQAQG